MVYSFLSCLFFKIRSKVVFRGLAAVFVAWVIGIGVVLVLLPIALAFWVKEVDMDPRLERLPNTGWRRYSPLLQLLMVIIIAVVVVLFILVFGPTKAGAQGLSQEQVERVREERTVRDLELNKRFWVWFEDLQKLEPDPPWLVKAKRALVTSKLYSVENQPKLHYVKGALLSIFPGYQPIAFEVFRPAKFSTTEGRLFPRIVLETGDFRALLMRGRSSLADIPRLDDLEFKVFWLAGGGADTTVLAGSFEELLEIADFGSELLPVVDRRRITEPFNLLGQWASAGGDVRWEVFDGLFRHQPRVIKTFNGFDTPIGQVGNFRSCDSRVRAQETTGFLKLPRLDMEIVVGWCHDYANSNLFSPDAASLGVPVEEFASRNLGNASVSVDKEDRLVLSGREARIVFVPVKQRRVLSTEERFLLKIVEAESNDIIAVSTSAAVFTVYRAAGRWLVFPEPTRIGPRSPFVSIDEIHTVAFEEDGVLVFVEGAKFEQGGGT